MMYFFVSKFYFCHNLLYLIFIFPFSILFSFHSKEYLILDKNKQKRKFIHISASRNNLLKFPYKIWPTFGRREIFLFQSHFAVKFPTLIRLEKPQSAAHTGCGMYPPPFPTVWRASICSRAACVCRTTASASRSI